MLEQAVSEAAGGCANVEADLAVDGDFPVVESTLQLETSAAHIFQILAEQADDRSRGNLCPGLVDFLLVDQHLACQNEPLSALARGSQSTTDQKLVESVLQRQVGHLTLADVYKSYHESASTRCSAKW